MKGWPSAVVGEYVVQVLVPFTKYCAEQELCIFLAEARDAALLEDSAEVRYGVADVG